MTVTITKERKTEYEWIVEELYSNDDELLSMYHVIAPNDLYECVEHTVDRLKEIGNRLEFYSICHDDFIIGYFAIEDKKLLTAFGIMPDYRCKETAIEFWKAVHDTAGDEIICALYDKNSRGQNFLLKHDAKQIGIGKDDEGNAYKTYLLCR